jgi:tol-pal system protein YbgF
MPRAQTWLGIPLLALATGCATARPEATTPAVEAERTISTLRAQNSSYVRQVEELQNRVFILEDRLDSQRVSEQQRVTPSLPVVKALRAEPPVTVPPPVDPAPAVSAPAPAPPTSELSAAEGVVEYAGEAAQPPGGRPALHLERAPSAPARQTLRPSVPVRVATVTPAAVAAPTPPFIQAHAPKAPAAPALIPAVLPGVSAHDDSEWREPIPAEPLRIYRDALEALRAGHHAAALAGFRRFLDHYPVHDYADNAQYWIGECYYDLHQYQAATREFRAVIERYPRGNKVPDAMLKLGFSHLALGQAVEGRQVLDSLVRAFPKHTSAGLATTRLGQPPFGSKADVSLGTIVPRRAGGR